MLRKTMRSVMKKRKQWTDMRPHKQGEQWQVCNIPAHTIELPDRQPAVTLAPRMTQMTGTSLGHCSMWSGQTKMMLKTQAVSQQGEHNVLPV